MLECLVGYLRVVPQYDFIDHSHTRAKSPQSNGICERFHKTVLDEFYWVAFRKKVYGSLEELQKDLDLWLTEYNERRVHSGKYCYGKTPLQTFVDSLPLGERKDAGRNLTDSCITAKGVCQVKSHLSHLISLARALYPRAALI